MRYKIEVRQYQVKVAEPGAANVHEPADVAKMLTPEFNPLQEEMHVLMLDTACNVVDKVLVAKGQSGSVYCQPVDVIRPMMFSNANRAILAHNHPSGNLEPSQEDLAFTRKMQEAFRTMGLTLLDHIIYTATGHCSFKGKGLL